MGRALPRPAVRLTTVATGGLPRRVVSVLQPGYLPYLGFFELMARSDVFVLYDDVQFDKNSWRNRNRILSRKGPLWLSVPVATAGRPTQPINETMIDTAAPWRRKHLETLRQSYARAPHFSAWAEPLADAYARDWTRLIDVDLHFIELFRRALGIHAPLVLSSSLGCRGSKTDRLVAICRELGADGFISTNGAKAYLDESRFAEAGIALAYQDYTHPTYPQHGEEFVPYMAAIDLLLNCGPDAARILLSTSRDPFALPAGYRGCTMLR